MARRVSCVEFESAPGRKRRGLPGGWIETRGSAMPERGSIVEIIPTVNGDVTVRYLDSGDAPALLEYINALSAEQTYLLVQGEQLTLEQEEAWLSMRLDEIASGEFVHLVAVA